MSISAINPSFSGRRENVDALVTMDDNRLRQIAYQRTLKNFDEKKNRRVTNALFYSAPIAAGLATAILSKGSNTKLFSKEVSGLAARAAKGLKVAAIWTAALGAIDLLGFAKNKLAKNSSAVRKFDREHPFLSLGAMLGAGIGAITLVNKGAVKLAKVNWPKFMQNGTEKVSNFINKNGFITKMKNGALNLAKRTPEALKDIAKTALDWSPTALLLGGLFHSISSAGSENKEFAKNYAELRDKQTRLTRARMAELKLENDFFKLDERNVNDLELVKNPLNDLS